MSAKTSPLPNIDAVPPFSADDQACFDEIRAVLAKHGKLTRFGVALLHDHFHVAEDEVLLETCDAKSRTLTVRPAKISSGDAFVETIWSLDVPYAGVKKVCVQLCQVHQDVNGNRGHDKLHQFATVPED